MTDEDAFQAHLDENPEDHLTRSVFADWLDDRGDPRGPGYRELARRERRPFQRPSAWAPKADVEYSFLNANQAGDRWYAEELYSSMPTEWYERLRPLTEKDAGGNGNQNSIHTYYPTRRSAEDAAARAWAALNSSPESPPPS